MLCLALTFAIVLALPQDLYVKSELELVHSVELLPWEIERLYSLVGAKVCAPPQTALELWHDARSCPPPLNIFGAAHPLFAFPSRAIIELVRVLSLDPSRFAFSAPAAHAV